MEDSYHLNGTLSEIKRFVLENSELARSMKNLVDKNLCPINVRISNNGEDKFYFDFNSGKIISKRSYEGLSKRKFDTPELLFSILDYNLTHETVHWIQFKEMDRMRFVNAWRTFLSYFRNGTDIMPQDIPEDCCEKISRILFNNGDKKMTKDDVYFTLSNFKHGDFDNLPYYLLVTELDACLSLIPEELEDIRRRFESDIISKYSLKPERQKEVSGVLMPRFDEAYDLMTLVLGHFNGLQQVEDAARFIGRNLDFLKENYEDASFRSFRRGVEELVRMREKECRTRYAERAGYLKRELTNILSLVRQKFTV